MKIILTTYYNIYYNKNMEEEVIPVRLTKKGKPGVIKTALGGGRSTISTSTLSKTPLGHP
jgi:hypothetical protein